MAEICQVCGLPKDVCVCQQIAMEQEEITISTTNRRYGKTVTMISGIKSDIDIKDIARKLKTKCATGGTVKNGVIELQGDQREKVMKLLREMGFTTLKCV